MRFGFSAPALRWRAFFVVGCLAWSSASLAAPLPSAPPLRQVGRVDPAEGRTALDQLRRLGIAGNYYLEFELRVMPRRGPEHMLHGRLWGGRDDDGPLTRVSLFGEGVPERRLLIQNGPRSAVWRWDAGKSVDLLGVSALFDPVAAGTELTAFDLQMPFIYWDDFTYTGVTRYRGRPAHVLMLRPPANFSAKHPALSAVRVYLDTQFNALVQTELIGASGALLKTISLVDLKKIGEQWIPKTFDVRDEVTRNKTRFSVTAAALDLDFSRTLFEPAQLTDEVRPPTAALTRL